MADHRTGYQKIATGSTEVKLINEILLLVSSLAREAKLENRMEKRIAFHFELQRQLEEQYSHHSPGPTRLYGQIRFSLMADDNSTPHFG